VEAGLLAKALDQSAHVLTGTPFREQARSHSLIQFIQVDRGEAIAAMRRPDKPAPTEKQICFCFYHSGRLSGRRAFDLDLRRPVKPRWPNAGIAERVNRQDAGLAALGQGWPIAATRGAMPECGHAEPKRGTEWWGKSVLLTFALYQK